MPLSSVADVCVWLRRVAQRCFQSVAQECRPVLPRSVVQRCRSEVSLKSVAYMCVGVFAQKCCSEAPELSIRGVGQGCRSAVSNQQSCSKVLLGSVGRKGCSAVWIRSVDHKCRSEVSSRSVDEQCASEVLIRSVAPSKVLRRSVALNYRSGGLEASIRSVAQNCRSVCRSEVSISSVESAVLL